MRLWTGMAHLWCTSGIAAHSRHSVHLMVPYGETKRGRRWWLPSLLCLGSHKEKDPGVGCGRGGRNCQPKHYLGIMTLMMWLRREVESCVAVLVNCKVLIVKHQCCWFEPGSNQQHHIPIEEHCPNVSGSRFHVADSNPVRISNMGPTIRAYQSSVVAFFVHKLCTITDRAPSLSIMVFSMFWHQNAVPSVHLSTQPAIWATFSFRLETKARSNGKTSPTIKATGWL